MKTYNVASIKNAGDYYEVVGVTTNQNMYLEEGDQYMNMSLVAAEEAATALEKGQRVFIPKNLENEVSPQDLIVNVPEELEKKKLALLHRARNIVTQAAATLRGFDFFEFTLCNNHLASKGFFITHENREEVYIEIINSGDEAIIEYLEKYLNLLDRIQVPSYQYDRYLEFEDAVKNATSLEELEEIEKGYRYF